MSCAEFPVMVEPVMAREPTFLIPPPASWAVLLAMDEPVIESDPALYTAPPLWAQLLETVQLVTASVPSLDTPPPPLALYPFETARPLMETDAPGKTRKMRDSEFPLTVRSLAPGPAIVSSPASTSSVPESVMVPRAPASNVMTSAPARLLASVTAWRSEPMPVSARFVTVNVTRSWRDSSDSNPNRESLRPFRQPAATPLRSSTIARRFRASLFSPCHNPAGEHIPLSNGSPSELNEPKVFMKVSGMPQARSRTIGALPASSRKRALVEHKTVQVTRTIRTPPIPSSNDWGHRRVAIRVHRGSRGHGGAAIQEPVSI
jgi:hypothetical protein